MRWGGAILVLAIIGIPTFSAPIVFAATAQPIGGNFVEGNWTKWTSVYKITGSWSAGQAGITVDNLGNVYITGFGGDAFYVAESASPTPVDTLGSFSITYLTPESAYGTYQVFDGSGTDFLVFSKGALIQDVQTSLSGAAYLSISSDGQWVAAADGNRNLQLFQATGTPASAPLTSNIGNGQQNYVYGGGPQTTTTIPPVGLLNGNLTQAQQTVANNPLPYGLIALIIILVIGTAVYLRYTQENKKGFRQPARSGNYRGP